MDERVDVKTTPDKLEHPFKSETEWQDFSKVIPGWITESVWYLCLVKGNREHKLGGLDPNPMIFTEVCTWNHLVKRFQGLHSPGFLSEVLYWIPIPSMPDRSLDLNLQVKD